MKVKVIWHGRSWSDRLDWHPGECNSGLGIDSAPPTSDIKPSGKPLINVKSVYFSLLEKRFEILRRYWLFKSAENRMLPGTGRVGDNPSALSEQSIWHWGHQLIFTEHGAEPTLRLWKSRHSIAPGRGPWAERSEQGTNFFKEEK